MVWNGESQRYVSDSEITYGVRDRIAILMLNRPSRLNAWTAAMDGSYRRLLDRAASDDEVLVIVITGAGRGYCSGADFARVDGHIDSAGASVAEGARYLSAMQVPKPVIAAVNGPCVGVGFAQALSCDIRLMSQDAYFFPAFTRRGLVAEEATSWLLPRIVGMGRAMEILLSSRKVMANEAVEIGLASVVSEVPVLRAAIEYAKDIAERCSPTSMAIVKRQIIKDYQSGLGESLALARSLTAQSFSQGDPAEGFASFRESRPPSFGRLSPVYSSVPVDLP